MVNYTERFLDRRCRRDRRDWDEFVMQDRRAAQERRSGIERRKKQDVFIGTERRKLRSRENSLPSYSTDLNKSYYVLYEVAEITQASASDILEWIRSNLVSDMEIKRDFAGRRLFTRRDIEQIETIKRYGFSHKH